MANSLNANPYSIDTAMTTSLKNTAGSLPSGGLPIFIKKITWTGFTASTTATVVDQNGTVIFTATVGASLPAITSFSQDFPQGFRVKDFKVSVLGSGVVHIHAE